MCQGLAARGHDVLLVAPVDAETERDGVRIIPTGLRGKVQRFLGAPKLLRLLADLEADVYHFHDPELLPWMVWLGRKGQGRRVVYDVHEYYPESVYTSNYFGWAP